ncbi:hypothetical protein QAD02_006728 [Eretmocerus hayati]|uniref:Uncharacterized protein n=1 Tax=Eretmocerus hayati TaxID=131215 RepID=A0ACC2N2X1_9HYME|nr:hypothetical protein QAD02_006728 [Eretmocerus hayati]
MCARTENYRSSLMGLKNNHNKVTAKTSQATNTPEVSDESLLSMNEIHAPYTVKMENSRLYLDEFVYCKEYAKAGRIYWRCEKYLSTGGCLGRAVTSDPSLNGEFVLYRGPNESQHNHSLNPKNAVETEDEVNIELIAPDCASKSNCGPISTKGVKSEIQHLSAPCVTSEEMVESVTESRSGSAETDLRKRKRELSFASFDSQNLSSPILIGKKLCINGYVYTVDANGPPTRWICTNNRSSNCPAKVLTSDLSKSDQLQIIKHPEVSEHNHPQNFSDLKGNEGIDTTEVVKIKKAKHNSTTTLQTPIGIPSNIENQLSISQSSSTRQNVKTTKTAPEKQHGAENSNFGSDAEFYRRFLTTFLKDPKFNRESVFKALRSNTSTSDSGCLSAYAVILQNRGKVEQDLKALTKDPNIPLLALNFNATCDEQENVESSPNLPRERLSNVGTLKVKPLANTSQHQKSLYKEQQVDAAPPILVNASTGTPTLPINSSSNEHKIKKEFVHANLSNLNLEQNSILNSLGVQQFNLINSLNNLGPSLGQIPFAREMNAFPVVTNSNNIQVNTPRFDKVVCTPSISAVDGSIYGIAPTVTPAVPLISGNGVANLKQEHFLVGLMNTINSDKRSIPGGDRPPLQSKE